MLKNTWSGANYVPNLAVNNRNVVQTTDSSFVGVDQTFTTKRIEDSVSLE